MELKPLSMQLQNLKLQGTYQHYKGQRYKVLYVGRHTETLEECVVYQALYGSYDIWVRPLEMFMGELEVNGIIVPRFTFIE